MNGCCLYQSSTEMSASAARSSGGGGSSTLTHGVSKSRPKQTKYDSSYDKTAFWKGSFTILNHVKKPPSYIGILYLYCLVFLRMSVELSGWICLWFYSLVSIVLGGVDLWKNSQCSSFWFAEGSTITPNLNRRFTEKIWQDWKILKILIPLKSMIVWDLTVENHFGQP